MKTIVKQTPSARRPKSWEFHRLHFLIFINNIENHCKSNDSVALSHVSLSLPGKNELFLHGYLKTFKPWEINVLGYAGKLKMTTWQTKNDAGKLKMIAKMGKRDMQAN